MPVTPKYVGRNMIVQGMIELLPDKETFDKTACPKCGELLSKHQVGDQWEAPCDVTLDELVKAGLVRMVQ